MPVRLVVRSVIVVLVLACCGSLLAVAEDISNDIRHAVERDTLDQPGTKPFHLKAQFAPSFERDKGTHREGEIELWWESPSQWRREIRTADFHQVAVMDGAHQWQKNEGDYFPEWIRELVQAIVRPVPLPMDVLLQHVKGGEVRNMRFPMRTGGFMQQTNVNWEATEATGDEIANGKGGVALLNGELLDSDGPGWSGLYHDFQKFHDRNVARTVASGRIEVTAKVTVLEDLGEVPAGFFDTNAPGGDSHPIETIVLSNAQLQANLLPDAQPFHWPALKDGPLEGGVGTEIVVDREGTIREMSDPISDNPGVRDAAAEGFKTWHFKPFLRDGEPVQAVGNISVRFKTVRPAGVESFESARSYFDRGRKASFLAWGATSPYVLKAEFQVGTSSGVQTGRYEDTWVSDTEWKREAWIGASHFARSRSGDHWYLLSEGSDAGILRTVFLALEPIPADDTMTESDWRISRDVVGSGNDIRVFRGPEGQHGELDPVQSQGYWFGEGGVLDKAYIHGLAIQPSAVQPFSGVQIARQVDVLQGGKLAMRISVTEVGSADASAVKGFQIKGHEWKRAFTAEER
ncbi:hypothetical protein [Silvibacterium dinghuense]|uniref:TonB C-terminal domain-containing protein n=1 Tax=Silvibacterium dinghuense TaxID=1560006 RepID=A0A4Q1SI64_9BACT|nr:hypothetical protein [Silvibacterium dinghuense]RXS97284.1 hypothetical protein ESZ00_05070 [Silvibacterium dinghuense]GGG97775.1 hypothetical protein GCM10011586_11330 [Silvibacterium dinghuense]